MERDEVLILAIVAMALWLVLHTNQTIAIRRLKDQEIAREIYNAEQPMPVHWKTTDRF